MSNELALAVVALLVSLWAWARVEVTIRQDRRAVAAMESFVDEELSRPADYRRFGCPDCPACQKMRDDAAAKNLGGRL